jgi:aspartate racemase
MEQAFYRDRLAERFGLDVITPPPAAREQVHAVIYDELCRGRTLEPSRAAFRNIAAALVDAGAQGIVFGCTEIGMLLGPADLDVPVFDTTVLHVSAAIDHALSR